MTGNFASNVYDQGAIAPINTSVKPGPFKCTAVIWAQSSATFMIIAPGLGTHHDICRNIGTAKPRFRVPSQTLQPCYGNFCTQRFYISHLLLSTMDPFREINDAGFLDHKRAGIYIPYVPTSLVYPNKLHPSS